MLAFIIPDLTKSRTCKKDETTGKIYLTYFIKNGIITINRDEQQMQINITIRDTASHPLATIAEETLIEYLLQQNPKQLKA